MRKKLISLIAFMLLLVACGSNNIEFTVEQAPKYADGETFPMTLKVMEDDEVVTGLDMVATLEMAKMDHGTIEVTFIDNGDGTYDGEVELPMAGEWIADIEAELDDQTYEKILTFQVNEG